MTEDTINNNTEDTQKKHKYTKVTSH